MAAAKRAQKLLSFPFFLVGAIGLWVLVLTAAGIKDEPAELAEATNE
jgi:hypothetical protein